MADQRGKLVILLMTLVAVAMAGYAWWHQRQVGRRSAEFWGTEAGLRLRNAPVEFLPLNLPGAISNQDATDQDAISDRDAISDQDARAGQRLMVCGVEYLVGEPIDITSSRGMIHARHALVDDLSFDWDSQPTESPQWEFLLRFRDHDQTTTVAFDTQQGLVYSVEQSKTIQMIRKIAAAFRQKRTDWQIARPRE